MRQKFNQQPKGINDAPKIVAQWDGGGQVFWITQ